MNMPAILYRFLARQALSTPPYSVLSLKHQMGDWPGFLNVGFAIGMPTVATPGIPWVPLRVGSSWRVAGEWAWANVC